MQHTSEPSDVAFLCKILWALDATQWLAKMQAHRWDHSQRLSACVPGTPNSIMVNPFFFFLEHFIYLMHEHKGIFISRFPPFSFFHIV